MALQGGTGFTGALSFLNKGASPNAPGSSPKALAPAPASSRSGGSSASDSQSRRVAETLLGLTGDTKLESQSRALALAFLDRHDEAIIAYEEAISEMTRLGADIAGDSLAMLYFKYGCELASSGHDTQALVALEKAIVLDSTYALQAKEDESWERLSLHPRFLDLVGTIDVQRLRAQSSRTLSADGSPSSDCFYLFRGDASDGS
jgi:hypothetical protein